MKELISRSLLRVAVAILLFTSLQALAFYDLRIGKWISRDPIEENGGLNLYGFVNNNPVDWIDDLGSQPRPAMRPPPAESRANCSGRSITWREAQLEMELECNQREREKEWKDWEVERDPLNRRCGNVPEFRAVRPKQTQLELNLKDLKPPQCSCNEPLIFLYQKVGPEGEHLKYGITRNLETRYSQEELGGGRLRMLTCGSKSEMLRLERQLHETLPIGPEEGQECYIRIQAENGLKSPPY